MSSDNLSAYSFGGFSCSFGIGRICRFCMAMYSEIKVNISEKDFILRNTHNHDLHVNAMQVNPQLPLHTYGVKGYSPFNHFNTLMS